MAASSLLDVCRFNPTLGGITDWTYSSAVTGYQSPAAAGVVNGSQYSYRAETSDLSQWEVGTGTYNTSTGVLSRTAVLFNSSGTTSKISFSSVPQIAIVALKEDLVAIRPKTITFTFDISLATNFSVTGVGFAPRAAVFHATVGGAAGQFAFGMTDGTTSGEIHGRGTIATDTMGVDATCFDITVSTGNASSVGLVSLDSDGFTFSRTKTGSPTGTATVQAMCFP